MATTAPMSTIRQYLDGFNKLHNDVTDDAAYVVVRATMAFSVHGQRVTQTGAILTAALRKLAEG